MLKHELQVEYEYMVEMTEAKALLQSLALHVENVWSLAGPAPPLWGFP